MSQLKKRERICPSFAFLFYLGPQQIGRCPPPSALFEEDWSLYSVYGLKCWSLPETPWQTHSEIMFCQLSGHPLAQSSWRKISHHRLGVFLTRNIKVLMERKGVQICEGCQRGKGVHFLLVLTEGRMRIVELTQTSTQHIHYKKELCKLDWATSSSSKLLVT